VQVVAFGDLFLEDVRKYREDRIKDIGLDPVFPLWKLETGKLIGDMLSGGLRCRIVCIDPKKLPLSFAGRDLDQMTIAEFPAAVDPCGENGEFHTCVYDGPMFNHAIELRNGDVVERDGFIFADLCMPRGGGDRRESSDLRLTGPRRGAFLI
jgi:diphthamide synthase (EF-2-diphthine--ammonia ligase)